MRKSGTAETCVRIVQDIYENSEAVVRCVVGVREGFKVRTTPGIRSEPLSVCSSD